MSDPRVLLMYVHEYSGHHRAALALEKAFRVARPGLECRLVDALRYAHPLLERLIQKTYLEILRKKPEVWGYLYDNPWVVKNTQALRHVIHKSHSSKLKDLLTEFKPDAIICTQAFPCGIVSDYKVTFSYPARLYGVVTDFLPHSYWVLDHVDLYFVPNEESKRKLHDNGVFDHKISVTGIPIDISFEAAPPVSEAPLLVLIMGGSQGFGSLEKIALALDKLPEAFEMAVVAGRNQQLYKALLGRRKSIKKNLKVYPFVERMTDLMSRATLLVTKPGGLTIAEALAAQLPMIFINPLPGQEVNNAALVLNHRAAVEARSEQEAALFAGQLLRSPAKLEAMKRNMAPLAHPDAALQIVERVLADQ